MGGDTLAAAHLDMLKVVSVESLNKGFGRLADFIRLRRQMLVLLMVMALLVRKVFEELNMDQHLSKRTPPQQRPW